MADWSRSPGAAPKSPKPPCPPPKGIATEREKAALLARSSGDPFISHSKNGPLVSNRPGDPEGKHPISLHRLDRTTGPTTAPVRRKQRVTLIWKKQKETLDNQATYFDSLDGDHRLLWDKINCHYEAGVELTCGEHSGCLALSDCDLSADIQTFHVQPLTTGIQCITISMVTPDKSSLSNLTRGNKVSTNKDNKGARREEEELQRIRESRKREEEQLRISKEFRKVEEDKQQKSKEQLEVEIRSLSLILEKDKKQAASNQQLSEYKREVEELKGQLEREKSEKKKAIEELAGHRNGEKLRDLVLKSDQKKTEYQPQIGTGVSEDLAQYIWNVADAAKTLPHKKTPVRKDYVNLQTANQRSEYYIEYKELEKSKQNICQAKLESEKLLDYLHCEKLALLDQLTRTKRELAESNDQVLKLKEIIRNFAQAPSIPARSSDSAFLSPRYVPPSGPLPPGPLPPAPLPPGPLPPAPLLPGHATKQGYRSQAH